jgi:hypothetical protein
MSSVIGERCAPSQCMSKRNLYSLRFAYTTHGCVPMRGLLLSRRWRWQSLLGCSRRDKASTFRNQPSHHTIVATRTTHTTTVNKFLDHQTHRQSTCSGKFNFAAFARELRNRVYEHALTDPVADVCDSCGPTN